jgi:hypothetical protein
MKNHFLIIILFIFSTSYVHAQFEFMQFENAAFNLKRSSFASDALKTNHIKSCTLNKLTSKGYVKTDEYLYNADLRLTKLVNFRKNGKKNYTHNYTYKNDTLITSFTVLNRHSDSSSWMIYVYDSKNRLIEREYKFTLFIVPDRKWKYQYNNMNKLSAYSLVDKKGNDSYRYEYDFFDNGSRKETRYFNKKNILKYKWSFDCDQKGEIQSNSVKQGNYCTKKELQNDGSFMEVFEYTNEKGKHTKTVYYYTADSNLTKNEVYNKKNELVNKWEYSHDKKGYTTQILYYNSKGLKKKYIYAYNEKDLCVKMDFYNKKGKLNHSYTYDYSN